MLIQIIGELLAEILYELLKIIIVNFGVILQVIWSILTFIPKKFLSTQAKLDSLEAKRALLYEEIFNTSLSKLRLRKLRKNITNIQEKEKKLRKIKLDSLESKRVLLYERFFNTNLSIIKRKRLIKQINTNEKKMKKI